MDELCVMNEHSFGESTHTHTHTVKHLLKHADVEEIIAFESFVRVQMKINDKQTENCFISAELLIYCCIVNSWSLVIIFIPIFNACFNCFAHVALHHCPRA